MNKVFNNDNMRRYVHMALSRQIQAMEEQGMTPQEIQAMIDASLEAYSAAQLQEAIENNYAILDPGEETYAYGVLIDFTQGKSSPDLKRIGNPELHRTLPVQSQYKGCIWDYANQEILYYLNPENWNLAVNDEINNVVKTAEQVAADMANETYGIRVETPKFYARSQVLATDGAGNTTMAKVMFSTQKLNPLYIEIPRQVTDFRNVRVGDDIIIKQGYSGPDLLCNMAIGLDIYGGYSTTKNEVSDLSNVLYPATNWDREHAREAAHNAKTNLMCYEYYKWLFYWAFAIEYATLNSHKPVNNELDENGYHQGGLGGGLTKFVENNGINLQDISGKDVCRYIGVTNSLGNGTGELNIPTDTGLTKTGHPNRYRGFECPFGDIYLVLDGFIGHTVLNNEGDTAVYRSFYTCTNPLFFKDEVPSRWGTDEDDNYTSVDFIEGGWREAFRYSGAAGFTDEYSSDDGESAFDYVMQYANIGNAGDLFPQTAIVDDNKYFVNYFGIPYQVTDSDDDTILYAGSYAHHDASDAVGLGYFSASYGLSFAGDYLGFRCFNIIKDDGTVI